MLDDAHTTDQAGMAVIRRAVADAATDVDAAVELGNRSTATLGFLPVPSYVKAADDGTLLLASVGDKIVGYALYGIARGRVRLTHLCVSPPFRKHGIARQLVEQISMDHADLLGIHVSCRRDYDLGEMWIGLNFSQRSERPGRSKKGTILVNWWRDHHHPNLLTKLEEGVLARAAIDLNILRDLAEPQRSDTRDVLALIDDQASDRLELIRTGALDAEIDKIQGSLRVLCIQRAQQVLTPVRSDPKRFGAVRAALMSAAQRQVPGYPVSPQDEFDLRHVSDAVACDLRILITRDERLRQTFADECGRLGLRIMKPAEVITHLDELVRAEAYRPGVLLDTNLRRQLLGTAHDGALVDLCNSAAGEGSKDFRKLLHELTLARRDRVGVFTSDNRLIAAYCAYREGEVLTVALARVVDHPLRETLARQLLFMIRQEAVTQRATAVRLTDPHVSPAIRHAAFQDGFDQVNNALCAYVLDLCETADRVGQQAVHAAGLVGADIPPPLRSGMAAAVTAELERAWWPAKIIDSLLPTYLVPIQQVFSTDLLGVPPGMLPRHEALGLSREHVYYRSPSTRPTAPARLVWYMSQTGHRRPERAAAIACSQLDTVAEGPPDEMHSRFRHLGVWSATQVAQAAKNGRVQALVFTNTEIFPNPIGLSRLRQLAAGHGGLAAPQQPVKISSALFADIYREGSARHVT